MGDEPLDAEFDGPLGIHDDAPKEAAPDPEPATIPVKRSTFNALIIGVVIAVGVASFFAGSVVGVDQISQKDLDAAISKLELAMRQEQAPHAVQISVDDDPVIGDPDAPITIVEFSDFQCPFCARFHVQTLPLLYEQYIADGKAKLVFRDFPIQSIHPNAVPASIAAECADEQGKFKAMHDKLFDNQQEWSGLGTEQALLLFGEYASDIELARSDFDSCLTSGRYIEEIRGDLTDGRSYGVTGTPGFFIGNDDIGFTELFGAQPFETFERIIDSQLGL